MGKYRREAQVGVGVDPAFMLAQIVQRITNVLFVVMMLDLVGMTHGAEDQKLIRTVFAKVGVDEI